MLATVIYSTGAPVRSSADESVDKNLMRDSKIKRILKLVTSFIFFFTCSIIFHPFLFGWTILTGLCGKPWSVNIERLHLSSSVEVLTSINWDEEILLIDSPTFDWGNSESISLSPPGFMVVVTRQVNVFYFCY